jgi:tetratricopeptide (TPR) repeat protein
LKTPVLLFLNNLLVRHRGVPPFSAPARDPSNGGAFPVSVNSIWFMGLLLAVAVLFLGGCGSSSAVQKGPAGDRDLEHYNRAAEQAFELGKLEQAAIYYRKAMARAYVGDDSEAVIDAQYNLAVCLMKLQSYDDALGLVQQAKLETVRAGQTGSADYLLLEATILQLTEDWEQAWNISDRILASTPPASAIIQSKTHFLRGLIANRQGDTDILRAEIVSLGEPKEFQLRADRWELLGYLAMAEHNWSEAVAGFDEAAKLRRETLDYRPMVRALALAGEASERAGRAKAAAVRYLRAGRSAALQGDDDHARSWLIRAERLANQAGDDPIAQESRAFLKQIPDTH